MSVQMGMHQALFFTAFVDDVALEADPDVRTVGRPAPQRAQAPCRSKGDAGYRPDTQGDETSISKMCGLCGELKPIDEFWPINYWKPEEGHKDECKQCGSERDRRNAEFEAKATDRLFVTGMALWVVYAIGRLMGYDLRWLEFILELLS
jgi:hypothetical protein